MNGYPERKSACPRWCLPLVLLLSGLEGLPPVAVASESPSDVFTPGHVARLRSVTSVRVSPDGNYIAYTLSVPRTPLEEPSAPARTELHVVYPNGSSRPFVTDESGVSNVAWTPDGRGIAFLAKRGKEKTRSLHVIPVDGGEARVVLAHGTDIVSYSFAPEGDRVAFVADDPVPDGEEELREKGFTQRIYEEELRRRRVHIARLESAEPPRALDLPGHPSELEWAPVGSRLVLALAPTPLIDDDYMRRKMHVVDADSGAIVASFDNPGKLGEIRWSPDGKHLALTSAEDLNDPSAGRLLVASAEGGALRQLLSDFQGDFTQIAWKDPETIVYTAAVGVWDTIGEVRLDGGQARERVPRERGVFAGLSASRDGRVLAMVGESPLHPGEVHAMSAGNEVPRRLTDSNPWLEGLRFARQEVVSYGARDGLQLEGLLVRPLDAEPGKRYPLILCVHGGPEAHHSNGWLTSYSRPGQVAAARGFAVFYPNYRGSTGRGVAFSKMGQADYAGKEFDDLVDAVDHLVDSGLVDRSKVGITGGSYGGYASAWGATYYSDRFAASVMFVGISDLISKTGTTDIPREMALVHALKEPYGNWGWFLERSPIYHVQKAKTPLLILHGADDTRVHPSQSMELYRHVKTLGRAPVRLVLYPGEGHGNRNSASRLDYNLRMLRWFEHYLKGPGGEPPAAKLDYPAPEKSPSEG